jgi:phage/plasmid-like protein (TIGR03299 family)
MAHELVENKDTMFSVKEKPWHGLGTVLENSPTIEEAIKYSGLTWEVGLKQLYAPLTGETMVNDSAIQEVEAQATYRKDNGDILGVVGMNYKPLQNIDSFNWFQPFIDSELVSLETAGSLFAGKKVFILAKINSPDSMIVEKSNDKIEKYILLSNSHDGKTAIRVGFTPIRVVCNNTLSMAHNNSKSKLIRVKHTNNSINNLENIRETMNLINQDFEATAEQFRKLATIEVNQNDVKNYFTEVFNLKNEDEAKRKQRTLDLLTELFETGRGNHLPGVSGTAWAAYNASTEYMQYYGGRNTENRFGSLWFGQNESKNHKALEIALTL